MRNLYLLGSMALLLSFTGGLPAGELTEAEFRRLHRELQPSADERWLTIPWKVDLLDGQQAAARERKPLFIWAMDGHPLGCV